MKLEFFRPSRESERGLVLVPVELSGAVIGWLSRHETTCGQRWHWSARYDAPNVLRTKIGGYSSFEAALSQVERLAVQ